MPVLGSVNTTSKPMPDLSAKLKVLSLDGGGVRGLSSLLILRHLMKALGYELDPPRPSLKPCEYFDLIGGTSTGGIIALMLGRMRMSVDECIDEYIELSKDIFSTQKSVADYKYSATVLEDAMKSVIRRHLGHHNEDAPLRDPLGPEACKTVVTSLRRLHASASTVPVIRSYDHSQAIDCSIWQAARATSAAATFFKPISLGSPPVEWIDAGLGYNNPSRALLMEATSLKRAGRSRYKRRDIGLFLSIGTGIPGIFRPGASKDFEEWVKRQTAKVGLPKDVLFQMKEIVTACERAHFEMSADFDDLETGAYFRFNVDQGMQGIELDEYEHGPRMTADTDTYMEKERKLVGMCVEKMCEYSVYEEIMLTPEAVSQDARVNELHVGAVPHPEDFRIKNGTRNKRDRTLRGEKRDDLEFLGQDPETWQRVVLADILDKSARRSLDVFYKDPEMVLARQTNDARFFVEHEKEQKRAALSMRDAQKLYQDILLLQSRLCINDSNLNLGYLWAAHRNGAALEFIGNLQLAQKWFSEALEGLQSKPKQEQVFKKIERVKAALERVKAKRIDVLGRAASRSQKSKADQLVPSLSASSYSILTWIWAVICFTTNFIFVGFQQWISSFRLKRD